MQGDVYEPNHRSTVNRYKSKAVYNHATVHGIIDSSPILHVSFNPTALSDDPFPTILPMIGCTGAFIDSVTSSDTETLAPATCIYMHGHVTARLMKLSTIATNDPHAIEEFIGLPGTPVCVAASEVDGYVLSFTPYSHNLNYRSAVIHGYANVVVDPNEKMYALRQLTNNLVSGRWENSRVPPTEAEMKATSVLRVDIVSASAKVRIGAPENERIDLDDGKEGVREMRERVWTGVIPGWRVWGDPVPAPENLVKEVPGHITEWLKSENDKGEAYSKMVASDKE